MKIAVTGANGFVGKHVLAELQNHAVEIIPIVRNTSSIFSESLQKKSIILDIHKSYPDNLFEFIGSPDVLIHLAWGGLPNYSALHHFEEELPKQFQFLKSVVQTGLKSLVVTGTCFEYGMQSGALHEEMLTSPETSYGFAKDALRRQLEFLQDTYPFSLTWARLFYLYGKHQAKNTLLSQLQQAIKKKENTFNMSGGEQLRDYLPIEQAAKYIVSIALSKKNIGKINICSGKPVSIRSLVEHWITENHWNIKPNLGYYPYPSYEPMAFWGNRSKLDTVL